MAQCRDCGSTLGSEVEICPICGTNQNGKGNVDLGNIVQNLSSVDLEIEKNDAMDEYNAKESEIERLVKRGEECFKSGKLWLGAKDRSKARKEFQRAFNYYETVLKLDPDNDFAREARIKCLGKMA